MPTRLNHRVKRVDFFTGGFEGSSIFLHLNYTYIKFFEGSMIRCFDPQ